MIGIRICKNKADPGVLLSGSLRRVAINADKIVRDWDAAGHFNFHLAITAATVPGEPALLFAYLSDLRLELGNEHKVHAHRSVIEARK